MCKHDATIIEKKRITVDLENVGKLVSEATQFSKVKNSQHQAASIIWVLEQYIQGDIFCWHIFVRSSVSSGHTCLSGHCPSLIFAEFHFQFIFKIILYSPLHRSSGFPWSFYVIRFWLSNQIGLGPANCSQVLPLNLWKTSFKSIVQKCCGEGFIYQV